MPPRKRARQRIRSPSPQESESEDVDVDNYPDDDQDDEIPLEDEEEDEIDDDEENDTEEAPVAPKGRTGPLKIKLKLPPQASSASTVSTPAEDLPGPRPRRTTRTVNRVESESESEDESSEPPAKAPSRMTARQARIARGGEDTELISLNLEDGPYAKKKKVLTETEVALRREETARKRKNLSEKKLEDEKAETINRLLKKQTRPRGKRTTALNEEKTTNEEEENEEEPLPPPPPPVPTMYRWVSTSKPPVLPEQEIPAPSSDADKTMTLSFAIPNCAFESLGYSPDTETLPVPPPHTPKIPQECSVEGCTDPKKYTWPKMQNIVACSMAHLHYLEKQYATS